MIAKLVVIFFQSALEVNNTLVSSVPNMVFHEFLRSFLSKLTDFSPSLDGVVSSAVWLVLRNWRGAWKDWNEQLANQRLGRSRKTRPLNRYALHV